MDEQSQTLNQAILTAIATYGERTCFWVKQGDHYRDISYHRFRILTFRMANFFRSQGIARGERVAIIADNSLEWMVAYVACLLAGGVVVPLRLSLPANVLHFALQDSGATVVVVNSVQQSKSIEDAGAEALKGKWSNLRATLVIDEAQESSPGTFSVRTILANSVPPEAQKEIRRHAESVAPQAMASIHYTAIETGEPKGAVFTQAQRLQAMQHLSQWLTFDEDDLAFTIIPWSTTSSLYFTLHQFLMGIPNALAESTQRAMENAQHISPTVVQITPFILESFFNQIIHEMSELPESSREVFNWALAISKEYLAAGPNASKALQEGYNRANLTFFSQIRGKIGGRMNRLYSAGASLPQHLADFIEAIGLLPLNIYSRTRAGGIPVISRPDARRPGSCGQVAPGFQIRIAGDGEILIKGPTAMRQYWQKPEETQRAIDTEGWLHTGDMGYLDEEGFLYLTGRKESLMVLSTGHKVMPSPIENALMSSPFIAHAAVFGEGRPYVSALIVPDLESLAGDFLDDVPDDEPIMATPTAKMLNWYWLQEHEEEEPLATTAHPEVKTLLDKTIDEVNQRLDRSQRVKKYSLLEQAFSNAANEFGELMPTGRHLIAERYKPQIKAMYPQTLEIVRKEITEVEVNPERMRELLAKESLLDAWMADAGIEFLFDLARQKEIDAPSMVHISDIAASIAQMEHEEKPLSTALIVGDSARIARHLPVSQVQLLRHDHIRRMRKMLFTLAPIVDGQVLGFVIDKHGYLRGIHKIDVPLDEHPSSFLLGPQFRRHAAISGTCDALVFFVPTGGKQVRVFANGELVGRYSNGDWSKESIFKVGNRMARLVEQKRYDLPLVQRVLRCAFQMAEENLGAIFIVGDADTILERSDAPEISYFAWIVSAEMDTMTDAELINFAKQDGATVVDTHGQFRGCMVLLRPGANTQAEIGPGKGARHSSAAKMSAEANCLAIAVSQDGPITVYDNGQRVLSL